MPSLQKKNIKCHPYINIKSHPGEKVKGCPEGCSFQRHQKATVPSKNASFHMWGRGLDSQNCSLNRERQTLGANIRRGVKMCEYLKDWESLWKLTPIMSPPCQPMSGRGAWWEVHKLTISESKDFIQRKDNMCQIPHLGNLTLWVDHLHMGWTLRGTQGGVCWATLCLAGSLGLFGILWYTLYSNKVVSRRLA